MSKHYDTWEKAEDKIYTLQNDRRMILKIKDCGYSGTNDSIFNAESALSAAMSTIQDLMRYMTQNGFGWQGPDKTACYEKLSEFEKEAASHRNACVAIWDKVIEEIEDQIRQNSQIADNAQQKFDDLDYARAGVWLKKHGM